MATAAEDAANKKLAELQQKHDEAEAKNAELQAQIEAIQATGDAKAQSHPYGTVTQNAAGEIQPITDTPATDEPASNGDKNA